MDFNLQAFRVSYAAAFYSGQTLLLAIPQGMPVTLIGEAVFARCLSALKVRHRNGMGWVGGGVMAGVRCVV